MKILKIRCEWGDYYDYRLMFKDGSGHVRVSFYPNQIIISDLFVVEKKRKRGRASALLNEVDKMIGSKRAYIVPSCDWVKEWYIRRGYIIVK